MNHGKCPVGVGWHSYFREEEGNGQWMYEPALQ